MLILIFILVLVSFIALLGNRRSADNLVLEHNKTNLSKPNNNIFSLFSAYLIIIILTLFAGLRTQYNDTWTYMQLFIYSIPGSLSEIKNIDFSLETYPGFMIYQIIIKSTFGANPQVFIFISSLIYVFSFVFFFYRYSYKFSFSIFLFLTSGLFIFGMAAVKQILAMSIGILAIHFLIQKKSIKFIITLFLASTFHPYILMYLITPLFTKKVWSIQIGILLLITSVGVGFLDALFSFVLGAAGIIGKEYQDEAILGNEGMSIIRIMVFAVLPALSWIFRRKINSSKDTLINIGVNLSIIGFLSIIPGYFGGANTFGRISYYFVPFTIMAFPWILYKVFGRKERDMIIFFCIVFYFIYFIYQYRGFLYEFQHIFPLF